MRMVTCVAAALVAVVGISSVIVQGFLVGRLLGWLGERRAILGGFVWSGLILIGYGSVTQGWMMYALILLGSLGGVAGPSLQGKISQMVGQRPSWIREELQH